MNISLFNGPVFIVGMSRSGTKLIREILNRNSKVGIPSNETHFIPYILKRFGGKLFPVKGSIRDELQKTFHDSIFFEEMKRKGFLLNPQQKERIFSQPSIQEFTEHLIRFYTDRKENKFIWGDKTPNNLIHIKLLKSFFPEAKFVHIIRDPRDRALSAHKAWQANLYIAADRWENNVAIARHQGIQIDDDYMEILYENLIGNPREQVQKLCHFIGIQFSETMLELEKPIENHGDRYEETRTSTRIVSNNSRKFLLGLTPTQIRKIDEIVFPPAKVLGYEPNFTNTQNIPLRTSERKVLEGLDQFYSLIYHFRRWGVMKGLRFSLWRIRINTPTLSR